MMISHIFVTSSLKRDRPSRMRAACSIVREYSIHELFISS
jgi:hypothetical protein